MRLKKEFKIIVLVVLIILFLILLFIGFNKFYNSKQNVDKGTDTSLIEEGLNDSSKNDNVDDNKNNIKKSEESMTSTVYTFDLSKLSCSDQTSSTCTKIVDAYFNGSDHKIKIESYEEKVTGDGYTDYAVQLNHKVYLDNELIHTIDGGVDNRTQADNSSLNINGFVYIFDNTNFALVLPSYSGEKLDRVAHFFANNKYIRSLIVASAWTSFSYKDKDLDSVSNLEFDGHTLKYWDLKCDNLTVAIQRGITIVNEKVNISDITTVSGVQSGGQACDGDGYLKDNINVNNN